MVASATSYAVEVRSVTVTVGAVTQITVGATARGSILKPPCQ